MEREALLEHIRGAHGMEELEPGGRNHEPGAIGFVESLDNRTAAELETLHREDHDDVTWHHEHGEG